MLKRRATWKQDGIAWCFLFPFMAVYTVFIIYPIIKAAYISAFDWNLMGQHTSVGFANYEKLLKDKYFWGSLLNTGKFMLYTTPTIVLCSLGLALLANRSTPLKAFFRSAYFVPHLLSISVISNIAEYMAQPYDVGLLSMLWHNLGGTGEFYFLSDVHLVWVTLTVATLWWTQGYNFLIYTAALQDIPDSLYEAADIDGASASQKLRYITLPMLKSQTFMIVMLQLIASAKVFGQCWLITSGGPGRTTRSIVMYIYQSAFDKQKLGYACAMSMVFFAFLLILTLIQRRIAAGVDEQ